MGKRKRENRVDPLPAIASLVEKPRRPRRYSLPSWLYRVNAITIKEDRDATDVDFDEDLSELEDEDADLAECDYQGGDDDDTDDYDTDDDESVASTCVADGDGGKMLPHARNPTGLSPAEPHSPQA
ncbi:hypothetical protein QBC33DRAFT_518676 [Phialemonium atrogriseum]|uniref:Uncharacterized protein n=1 Tax=Phialemonium atrogriseum TaxID=1093897 RepID=A0AAJ0FDJ1_9PEZI|nr:uncharacterized protein QBC33DRAFT_518676 [Phialemonium atrogriseum]KAK1763302.1 hypothetical protein QBC33DRAFT_518676 [Phialemonium atrogriseum]